jgi:hypothetical protein
VDREAQSLLGSQSQVYAVNVSSSDGVASTLYVQSFLNDIGPQAIVKTEDYDTK